MNRIFIGKEGVSQSGIFFTESEHVPYTCDLYSEQGKYLGSIASSDRDRILNEIATNYTTTFFDLRRFML